MASNQLTASVRLDTKRAEASITNLTNKINRLNQMVNKAGNLNGYNQMATATRQATKALGEGDKAARRLAATAEKLKRTEYQRWWQEALITREKQKQAASTTTYNKWVERSVSVTEKVRGKLAQWKTGISQAVSQNGQFNKSLSTTDNIATRLFKTLKRLAATYLGIMGTQSFMKTSDTITQAKNQLNNLPNASPEQTKESMTKIYAAAQRSRGSYTDMLANVGQVMTLAGDSFQNDTDNATRFLEIMNKSYAISGTKDEAKLSSMYQLIQGLSSGVLQGDELKSVREGATKAYQAIEKYAQSVLKTKDSLKDLASEGLITSDMVVAAIMNAEEEINESFNNTKMTFSDVINSIKNMATMAFTPVFQKIEDALNSSMGQAFITGIGRALVVLADTILWLMDIFAAFFTWCAENWNWLKYIVIAVLTAIILALGVYVGVMIASAIKSAIAWVIVHWQLVLIIAVLSILVAMIVYVANTTKSGCDFMVKCLVLLGVAIGAIGAILGMTWLMWVGLAIMAIGLLLAVFMEFGDVITGAIFTAGAAIYNFVVGVIDGIISGLWANFVEPVAGMIEWFVNAWNGGFTSVGGAFANFCGQLLSGLIGLLKPFATVLDKVFGWNTKGAIETAQANMKSWGKAEGATSFKLETPTLSKITGGKLPERIAYTDAWNKGLDVGAKGQQALESLGSSLKNKVTGGLDKISNLGMEDFVANSGVPHTGGGGNFGTGTGLPNPYDPAYGLGNSYDPSVANDDIDNALKKLGNIDDNTGSMADSMELTDDDLEYLRKLAEQEWKKEFTTAEIKVDMSNYNTVNGDSDLDGIVTRLADKLYDELDAVANGVYA